MAVRGIVLLFMFMLSACSEPKAITVNKRVDLQRYAGKWYELASFPTHFDTDCSCTYTEYTLHRDHITVQNTCFVTVRHKTHLRSITGKARPIPGTLNSHWSIEFYWPLKANYWIVYISDDYQYALVSEPSKDYLWILSRKPNIDALTYQHLLSKLRRLGFDLSLLRVNSQCPLDRVGREVQS